MKFVILRETTELAHQLIKILCQTVIVIGISTLSIDVCRHDLVQSQIPRGIWQIIMSECEIANYRSVVGTQLPI